MPRFQKPIELHLSESDREIVQKAADIEGRSRKNFCETVVIKIAKEVVKTNQ